MAEGKLYNFKSNLVNICSAIFFYMGHLGITLAKMVWSSWHYIHFSHVVCMFVPSMFWFWFESQHGIAVRMSDQDLKDPCLNLNFTVGAHWLPWTRPDTLSQPKLLYRIVVVVVGWYSHHSCNYCTKPFLRNFHAQRYFISLDSILEACSPLPLDTSELSRDHFHWGYLILAMVTLGCLLWV